MTDKIVGTYLSAEIADFLMDECKSAVEQYYETVDLAKKALIEKNRKTNPYKWTFWPFKRVLMTDEELLWYNTGGLFSTPPFILLLDISGFDLDGSNSVYNKAFDVASAVEIYESIMALIADPPCETVNVTSEDMEKLKILPKAKIKLKT